MMKNRKNSGSSDMSPENREGKEKLVREIEESAREEAEAIVQKARENAELKLGSARSKAERIKKDLQQKAEKRCDQISRLTDSSIKVRKKRIFLKQSERIVDFVFSRVREEVRSRTGSDGYVKVLEQWAVEAVLGIGTESIRLYTSTEEKELLTPDFLKAVAGKVEKLSGRSVILSVGGEKEKDFGIRAVSEDGRLEFRNQISTRLQRNDNYYRKLIRDRLDSEGTV